MTDVSGSTLVRQWFGVLRIGAGTGFVIALIGTAFFTRSPKHNLLSVYHPSFLQRHSLALRGARRATRFTGRGLILRTIVAGSFRLGLFFSFLTFRPILRSLGLCLLLPLTFFLFKLTCNGFLSDG